MRSCRRRIEAALWRVDKIIMVGDEDGIFDWHSSQNLGDIGPRLLGVRISALYR